MSTLVYPYNRDPDISQLEKALFGHTPDVLLIKKITQERDEALARLDSAFYKRCQGLGNCLSVSSLTPFGIRLNERESKGGYT